MEKIYVLRKYISGSIFDIENISKKQIQCVAPKLFNDPIDTYFYYSNENCFKNSKKILTPKIMESIRICCFIDIKEKKQKNEKLSSSELLMWTHYANSHKGLCFEYEVPAKKFAYFDRNDYDHEKKYLQPVRYQKCLATEFESFFTDSEIMQDNYEDLLQTCFFTKDDSFKYENEVRLLLYTNQEKSERQNLSFPYLKKIIFGNRCDQDLKYLIHCINKQIYKNKISLFKINEHFKEEKYEMR